MESNPLRELGTFGQSVWLDFIRRGMLDSGELRQLIEQNGVRGVTSNPAIFEKAINGSQDYDEAIRELAIQGKTTDEIYRKLTVEDIQRAADLFGPVYEGTHGKDGFVSLEVSPHLAHDTEGTIKEAHELWEAVGRPNLMIKVPGTSEGLPAVEQLLSDGINVNVTLLFGLRRYAEVIDAYITGLERRAAQGLPIDRIASVASFFLSRIDTAVDGLLGRLIHAGGPKASPARSRLGTVAVASGKLAYRQWKDAFDGERFEKLADQGARPQRLLWASTSTKNPAYSDVMYVEPLVGPQTINTLPLETLEAYRDHGRPASMLERNVPEARITIERLPDLGIKLDQVTQQLEDEGVEKFIEPFDRLMESLASHRAAAV